MKDISTLVFLRNPRKICKIITILFLGLSTLLSAQQRRNAGRNSNNRTEYYGRMGLNTYTPKATLEIHKMPASELVAGAAQGVIFPRLTTAERKQFAENQLTDGLLIYNTDKKCVELCYDYEGHLIWKCLSRDDPKKVTYTEYINEDSLLSHTFNVSISSYYGNTYIEIPVASWQEKILKKQVTIAGQTETLVLTIPAGESSQYGIYLENAKVETESGNPLDISSLDAGAHIVTFETFLDEEEKIYMVLDIKKFQPVIIGEPIIEVPIGSYPIVGG